jgi:hypothetical protein
MGAGEALQKVLGQAKQLARAVHLVAPKSGGGCPRCGYLLAHGQADPESHHAAPAGGVVSRGDESACGHCRLICHLAAGVFIALGIVGLDKTVTSLLAGAGIVALAIGLAFQNIATNFIAGIFLSTRRPFQLNHLVETNNVLGTVQSISLRSTELRTPQGQVVLIPNKEVFEKPIVNYTVSQRRRIDLKVDIAYSEDLEKVKRIASQALEGVSFRQGGTARRALLRGVRGQLNQVGYPPLD